MVTLKVGICVDPMGGGGKTQDEEIKQHQKWLRLKWPTAKLTFYKAWHTGQMDKGIQPGTDLFLFDYGGMMLGNDLAGSNARGLFRWLQDNPSSLCLVMSGFTWGHVIEYELEQAGIKLTNLTNWCEEFEIPEWFTTLKGLVAVKDLPRTAQLVKPGRKA